MKTQEILQAIKTLLLSILYLAGVGVLIALCWLLCTLRTEAQKVVPTLQQEIHLTRDSANLTIATQMELTRRLVSNKFDKTQNMLTKEIEKTREQTLARVDNLTETADRRLASIQEDVNSDVNSQLTRITDELHTSLEPVNRSTTVIADSLKDVFLCYNEETGEGNVDCFYNRYVGTMRGVENMSKSVGKMADEVQVATPKLVANAESTSQNISSITGDVREYVHEFTHPPWWKKAMNVVGALGVAVWTGITSVKK